MRFFRNPRTQMESASAQPSRAPLGFHQRLPAYSATPLVRAEALSDLLGVAEVLVKDESSRLGLPSFKILGASWAAYNALEERLGRLEPWRDVEELSARLRPHLPLSLAAATDGNHGRAVARMASLLGLGARIFVPAGTAPARIEGIESEGAECVVVEGSYEDAVARSAQEAGERCLVVSDTSWPGYEETPRRVIEGYSTIFWEIEDELADREGRAPDLVVIQAGVGALAAAAARHFRRPGARDGTTLVAVEPLSAACVLASMEAGRPTLVPGPHRSIMAGLNCGMPSIVAWPDVSRAFDLFLAIDDERARAGMRVLAEDGVVAGETGAAGVGALLELADAGGVDGVRLGAESRVLVLCTEGATDPDAYRSIVGDAVRAAPPGEP